MKILDIGAGIRPQTLYDGDITALEPCAEYREWLAANRPDVEVVAGGWQDIEQFAPYSFDYVTLLDIVEHVEKDEALRLLELTKPVARVSVVVFTPHGFLAQAPGPDGLDAWGMHGGEFQRHVSGWMPEDFPGWAVRVEGASLWAQWSR